jgi:hypothetical protein
MVTIRAMFQITKNLKSKATNQAAWELVELTCHYDAYDGHFPSPFLFSIVFDSSK